MTALFDIEFGLDILDDCVAISAFALQESYGRHHGGDDQSGGDGVREHVSDDCFWCFREAGVFDQLAHLQFQGSMAAQEAHTAAFEALHARILKRTGFVARVSGRGNMRGVVRELAEIIWISHGRLAGERIVDLEPGADLVFFPDIIVVVEEIGRSVHAADYLDLIDGHSKSIVQTIQGILYLGEGCSILNARDVEELFDSRALVQQGIK